MYSPQQILNFSNEELLCAVKAEKIGRKIHVPLESLDLRFYAPPTNLSLAVTPCKEHKRISKGEKECKRVLCELFAQPFYRVRSKELSHLELDCFNPQLGIACEYHGKQHYVYPSRYVKKKRDFLSRLRRDLYKLALSRQLGILLIVVPYIVKVPEIKGFILERLSWNGIFLAPA